MKSGLAKAAKTRNYLLDFKRRSTQSLLCGGVFDLETVKSRPGFELLRIAGPKATDTLRNEAGGHRFQRSSPTDKRGRVHTSSITVAILPEQAATDVTLLEGDIDWTYMRGSGAGGQNRNKLETACRARHRPTGITVRCESERYREQNKRLARQELLDRLQKMCETIRRKERERCRQDIGTGMRGDKVRTIRIQDNQVTCHVTGRKTTYKKYKRGDWDKLLGD